MRGTVVGLMVLALGPKILDWERSYKMHCLSTLPVFVPGKPFQPSLMFAGKAGTYPTKAPGSWPHPQTLG